MKAQVNFNSIKVRLERQQESEQPDTADPFQFHKGTIRTREITPGTLQVSPFQFHKGTIRTSHSWMRRDTSSRFQFHKGTIRTIYLEITILHDVNFNSIKLRLELYCRP